MRDLYCHVRSLREKFFQKDLGFLRSVRPMMIDVCMHVYDDGHVVLIGSSEYLAHFGDVVR